MNWSPRRRRAEIRCNVLWRWCKLGRGAKVEWLANRDVNYRIIQCQKRAGVSANNRPRRQRRLFSHSLLCSTIRLLGGRAGQWDLDFNGEMTVWMPAGVTHLWKLGEKARQPLASWY